MNKTWLLLFAVVISLESKAAENVATLPAPLGIPAPGPTNDSPYAPQPILQGGGA